MDISTSKIANLVAGSIEGSPPDYLAGVASLAEAGPGDISFYANPQYRNDLLNTRAGLVLIAPSAMRPSGKNYLLVDDPYSAWCDVLNAFFPQPAPPPGVNPGAIVHPSAKIGPKVSIGAHAVIEAEASIGEGTRIDAGVIVERGATIGRNCHLRARAVVGHGCRLGDRVILQPGVILGGDGFGFAVTSHGMRKIPQVGIVDVGDDVEIGANTTVDRATFGVTRIGSGVKIDNLVMIAHNVHIGEHSAIVAQAGIAGSTRIGMGVQIGGQAGLAGHLQVGDGARIGGQAGIMRDVEPGSRILGSPAVDDKLFFRIAALTKRLPEFWRRLRRIEEKLGLTNDRIAE